jgi:hypothetical protein
MPAAVSWSSSVNLIGRGAMIVVLVSVQWSSLIRRGMGAPERSLEEPWGKEERMEDGAKVSIANYERK